MIVVAYILVQWFGFINGMGIAALCWLLTMVILDDRLERREARQYEAYMLETYGTKERVA